MALELRSTVIKARYVPHMVSLRQGVVGGELRGPVDAEREYVRLWGTPLAIQRSPAKNRPPGRWHLDFFTSSSAEQRSEVEPVVGLGARVVRDVKAPDDDYVVLEDPEGNLFCICLGDE